LEFSALTTSTTIFLGLPKALRSALEFLASEGLVKQMAFATEELLHRLNADAVGDVPELNFDDEVIDINWSEGTEKHSTTTEDEIWEALGLGSEHQLPFFNTEWDPDGLRDPWTKEGKEWFAHSNDTVTLKPRWHQLVGVLKIVESAFLGKNMLIMDDVGIGKTLQLAASIAVLAFFRDHYQKWKRFPGAFGAFVPLITNHCY
jgi:hypothetical protein